MQSKLPHRRAADVSLALGNCKAVRVGKKSPLASCPAPVAVDRAFFCIGTQGMRKGAGRDAVQRASEKVVEAGVLFLCKAVLIILNVISILSVAMKPFRCIRMAS